MNLRLFTTCLLGASMLSSPVFAASDAEVAALKAQIDALTKRLESVEGKTANGYMNLSAQPAQTPVSNTPMAHNTTSTSAQVTSGSKTAVPGEGQPVVGGSLPGSFKLPGTNTSVKFGGYAKLDAIYDTNGYGARFANFAAIPLDGSAAAERNGRFNMHARQSRLNMETRTPTSLGEMKTFLELDFFGSATGNPNTTNGEGLQLRQAYGQVGKVLAGQTWSNFMDLDAYPESLDYIGPAGLTFVRQAQVRYTDTFADKYTWSVAIESPVADFAADTVPETDVDASDAPDLTAKLQYKDTFGHLALRGLARKINASTAAGAEDSDYGWGLGVSGKINTWDKDNIFFQGVYGDGIGHYLFDVAISNNGNTYTGNDVEPVSAWGGYLAYQHYWSDEWRSNILGGYTSIDNNDATAYATSPNQTVASGHLNLIWQPNPVYRVGFEYMYGYRELESGVDGDLNRFQTSFMYLF
jgi:hypothetical protein